MYTAPRQRREILRFNAIRLQPCRDRARDWMVGMAGQHHSDMFRVLSLRLRIDDGPVHQPRLTLGDRAGLVQRNRLELARLFKVNTSFDENAAAGGCREPTDNSHRCRDHQRTRTGNDQQHERLVDGLHPGPVQQPWSEQRDRQREHEDGWRIDSREPVDEALRRRARRLRYFDSVDDARKR